MGTQQIAKWYRTLLGTRRKQIIAASVVVLLVGGGVTTTVLVSKHQADQAAERAAEQKIADDIEAERERAAAEKQQRADELAGALSAGTSARSQADTTAETAASYAEPELLAALATAREKLDGAVQEGTDTSAINSAKTAVLAAIASIGTKAQADDRKYVALEVADGRHFESQETVVRMARDYCASLTEHYDSSVPADAVSRLLEDGPISRDDNAITVYCPAFLPSLNLALTGLWDGYHIVADAFGVDGQGRDTIKAGTYRTLGGVSDCYWEVSNGSGDTLSNDFISNAHEPVTVTVRSGQGFQTEDCGAWLLVG